MRNGPEILIDADEIRNLMYKNAEQSFAHTTYREELKRFYLLEQGDYAAVDESIKMMNADIQGTLSTDPLRNFRYLFIVNTGLATRSAIEAGAPQELVYSISDLYIQRADAENSIDGIRNLNKEFWIKMVDTIRASRKEKKYSRSVTKCIDHITLNFNKKITLNELSEVSDLTPCYLASLFKKETGVTVGEYLTRFRMDSARALLARTDYSYSKIALSLGFCSQSHFTKTFKTHVKMTPKEYRTAYGDTAFSIV